MSSQEAVNMEIWQRLFNPTLYLDQTETPLEIDRLQVERFYQPLAERLIAKSAGHIRLMVAVAGPPGSGKSAFAAILRVVTDSIAGQELTVVVGLDGWHFPNGYLESHSIAREGKQVSLRRIKGAPESFDAEAAYACFYAIRQGGEVNYPVYSRSLHDPLPGAGCVLNSHAIVIVEGNYLLLDETPWRKFRELFDSCVFLKIDPAAVEADLIERHRRGGKSSEAIQHQVYEVDLPDARRVLSGLSRAEIIIHKSNPRLIERIEYLDKEPIS